MEFVYKFLPEYAEQKIDKLLIYNCSSPCPSSGSEKLANSAIFSDLVSNNINSTPFLKKKNSKINFKNEICRQFVRIY